MKVHQIHPSADILREKCTDKDSGCIQHTDKQGDKEQTKLETIAIHLLGVEASNATNGLIHKLSAIYRRVNMEADALT